MEEEETRIRMQMMILRERWMHSLKFSKNGTSNEWQDRDPGLPTPPGVLSRTYLPTHHDINIYIYSPPQQKDPERKTLDPPPLDPPPSFLPQL